MEVSGQRHPFSALPPRNRRVTHCKGGWVDPRIGLDKFFINSRTAQPVARRSTHSATPGCLIWIKLLYMGKCKARNLVVRLGSVFNWKPCMWYFPCLPRTLVQILSTNSPSSNHSNSLLLRSSRPGRPPKRATVGLSIAATHLAQQHHHQLKKHRLDNGEYPGYENGHLGGEYTGSLSHSVG